MLADLLTTEDKVLLAMSLAMPDREVARVEGKAVQTIKNRRQSIYSKLGIHGTHPLIQSVMLLGWLKVPEFDE